MHNKRLGRDDILKIEVRPRIRTKSGESNYALSELTTRLFLAVGTHSSLRLMAIRCQLARRRPPSTT